MTRVGMLCQSVTSPCGRLEYSIKFVIRKIISLPRLYKNVDQSCILAIRGNFSFLKQSKKSKTVGKKFRLTTKYLSRLLKETSWMHILHTIAPKGMNS